MKYKSAWWSVELPPQWQAVEDGECSTLRADPPLGVLQISAARNNADLIADDDLREFAHDRVGPDAKLEEVGFGEFSGFTTAYRENELSWQEWWLRLGHLMIYITYNVVCAEESSEQDVIKGMLGSLRAVETR